MIPDGHWEHFEHGADIGVRGVASTLADAFEQAALAMTAVISDPVKIMPQIAVTIQCAAPDNELLLTDWLNALIYEMATRNMLFGRFDVTLHDHTLSAMVWGEAVDVARHAPTVEVKGATFTELKVQHREDGQWMAQCVVDV